MKRIPEMTAKEDTNIVGNTALILSESNCHKEINELISLMLTAERGKVGILKELIFTERKMTTLISVAATGDIDIVKYLVGKGYNIEAKNKYGDTALTLAACNGHKEVVEYLVEKLANIEAANIIGDTALTLAENNGHREVVEYLVKAQANNYYTKVLNNIPAVLIRDPCPITQEEIKNPVFLKDSENKSLYEISAIISWLFRHDTNPLTRKKITITKEIFRERLEGPSTKEGIIPEKIHKKRLEGQERLTYILKTVLCYPMKPIIVFIKNSCKILKRMAQGRNKYRAMISQMILQKMIMDFRVKQVVNIQALARGRHIRFKYKKSEFKSKSLQMHNL